MTCKGCERNNQMMEMDIESAIVEQLSMELNHASNELRDQRLIVCSACPALSEHTQALWLLRSLPCQSAGQTLPLAKW